MSASLFTGPEGSRFREPEGTLVPGLLKPVGEALFPGAVGVPGAEIDTFFTVSPELTRPIGRDGFGEGLGAGGGGGGLP